MPGPPGKDGMSGKDGEVGLPRSTGCRVMKEREDPEVSLEKEVTLGPGPPGLRGLDGGPGLDGHQETMGQGAPGQGPQGLVGLPGQEECLDLQV